MFRFFFFGKNDNFIYCVVGLSLHKIMMKELFNDIMSSRVSIKRMEDPVNTHSVRINWEYRKVYIFLYISKIRCSVQ